MNTKQILKTEETLNTYIKVHTKMKNKKQKIKGRKNN